MGYYAVIYQNIQYTIKHNTILNNYHYIIFCIIFHSYIFRLILWTHLQACLYRIYTKTF
jgi:hypothetical protein